MKVVQINTVCGTGSTGKICQSISELLTEKDIENYIIYNYGTSDYSFGKKNTSNIYIKLQAAKSKIIGNYGFNSRISTRRIIRQLEKIQPQIVHIHNIHSHDCDLEMLFKYLKKKAIRVVWTFHDCWAFTGYCVYFTNANCNKWKTKCEKCIQRRKYSLIVDRSKKMYEKKKSVLNDLKFSVVTPSQWLAAIVKESFLKEHSVVVINNGIDLELFSPKKSNFREINDISEEKYIILGVANEWENRKGLDIFVKLSSQLPEDKYQIILVGTNEKVDSCLPDNIKSIHRTQNQQELAELYSSADVFVNPTREDNFPTVNIESLACGTPVITFDTGGSAEMLDELCGSVIECDDFFALEKEIRVVCESKKYSRENCRKRAKEFDKNIKFEEYINFYMEMMNE